MQVDALAHGVGQVEAAAIVLEHLDDAARLLVVAEVVGENAGEGRLAGVAERRVADVVPQADRLGQILVEAQGAGNCAGDLRDGQGVRQAGGVVVAKGRNEDLSLMLQAPKRLAVEDAVAVALVGGADRAGLLGALAHGLGALCGERREQACLERLLIFAWGSH